MSLSEDEGRNREAWTKANANYTDKQASETWGQDEPSWGTYGVPEAELKVLGDVAGKNVIELGCGTRRRRIVGASRAGISDRPRLLRLRPRRLGTALAGRGDLEGSEALSA